MPLSTNKNLFRFYQRHKFLYFVASHESINVKNLNQQLKEKYEVSINRKTASQFTLQLNKMLRKINKFLKKLSYERNAFCFTIECSHLKPYPIVLSKWLRRERSYELTINKTLICTKHSVCLNSSFIKYHKISEQYLFAVYQRHKFLSLVVWDNMIYRHHT